MGKAAIAAARAVQYDSAGTVEFLYDMESNSYFFMEMNTRIQVEHPVTEEITGVDLIKQQIKISDGKELCIKQNDIHCHGHALECRINAEDPNSNFTPTTGKIRQFIVPGGPGIRIDSGVYPGYTISPYYDSMIAKLIVWGKTRREAIDRMKRALCEFIIEGVKTTIPFHQKILKNKTFLSGKYTTNFINKFLS